MDRCFTLNPLFLYQSNQLSINIQSSIFSVLFMKFYNSCFKFEVFSWFKNYGLITFFQLNGMQQVFDGSSMEHYIMLLISRQTI